MGKIFSISCASVIAFVTMSPAAEPETFTPEIYRSRDGKESIALISADKVEHAVNEGTTIGKYTWEKNTLRLTLSTQGVSFTMDYRVTRQGLVSKNGNVLYKKKAASETVEEIELDPRRRDPETKFPAPAFPAWARENAVSGTLVLSVTVDDHGTVADVTVSESCGNRELDMYTRNWVLSRWRFPKGKASIHRVPVLFKLRSDDLQSDSARSEKPVPAPSASNQKNFPAPPYPGHVRDLQSDVSLTIGMAVNASGEVVSTKIIKPSGHEKLDTYTAEWIQKRWKFPQGIPRFLQQRFTYSPGDLKKSTGAATGGKSAAP